MRTLSNVALPAERVGALHRHEAQLFKLLLRRQLRWAAIFKQLWRPVSAVARFLRAALTFVWTGELVQRVGPHVPPRSRAEWERLPTNGPPRHF